MRTIRNTKIITIAVIVVVTYIFFSTVFLPEIASIFWHFRYGNSARFLAWEVPVPWGWREFSGDNSIIIQKLGRWNMAPSNAIVTTLIPPVNSVLDIEELKKSTIETQLKNRRHFISERKVQLDGEPGSCLAFAENERPDLSWVTCDFLIHRLSIGYIGTKGGSYILDIILPNMRPLN